MTGRKIRPTLYSQRTPPIASAMIPPRTNPPGHPAWSMFRYFVFSVGNRLATTGLATASTVPLPSARMNVLK